MLVQGPADGVLLGEPAPHPGTRRRPGQPVQQRAQHGVAGGGDDPAVELQVGCDEFLHGGLLAERVQPGLQGVQLALRDAGSGHRGGGGLQDAPHREELQHRVVAVEVHHEAHGLQQQLGIQAGHIGAVALPYVQDADQRQRPYGLAQGVARQAQLGRQLALLGQPVAGAQRAGDDHPLDLLDRLVGNRHSASSYPCCPLGLLGGGTCRDIRPLGLHYDSTGAHQPRRYAVQSSPVAAKST